MPIQNVKREIVQDDKTLCDAVDAWFKRWFHNTPGISDNPMIINRCLQAKDELIAALRYDPPTATEMTETEG
jgi:hypothetical protein